MNKAITEVKNTLEEIYSRLNNDPEDWISALEDRVVEIMEDSWLEKIVKINEDSSRHISDNKYINIWITGIPEGEERQKV